METIICDISAFLYWRVPPVVRLLASAADDDPLLANLVSPEELSNLCAGCAELPLARACASSGTHWRAAGEASRAIRTSSALLSVCMEGPVDVLVTRREQTRRATIVRPRLWSAGVPQGELSRISDDLRVVSPGFALLQLARRASLARTVLLAAELCGSFAVYSAPECLREVLQRLVDANLLPRMGGWEPCLDREGKLTDLWSRKPLVTPADLRRIAEQSPSPGGRERLLEAARLVTPGAASPFEARAGIILGFSRRRGGEGQDGFAHNQRIALTPEARALAGRLSCYCDLYWREGLDLECQSRLAHDVGSSFLSDSDRTAALKLIGVEVLPVTYRQLKNEARTQALSKMVAEKRGVSWAPPTERQRAAGRRLRGEVLVDWGSLPFV